MMDVSLCPHQKVTYSDYCDI